MYCPLSYFMPDFNAIGVFLFSLAAALVSVLSLIHILTKRLAAPLSELNKLINQVSFENLSIPMSMSHSYNHSYHIVEIENIKRSFQTMLNQLKVEIARNAEARANEERANTIALQAQMNPHTIYNTIAMIESVCYMNGDFEASNLCISFSQMLRYISDNTKSVYTVEDELQHLAHYAALIKKRYESRLEIEMSVDESLLSKVIPKFTLQPLVENSVKHGMNRNSNPFIVHVKIEKEPSLWRIIVSDNGTGFTEEKLHKVFEQFANCDASLLDHKSDILKTKIDNMALNNIYIRWRIAMGARFLIRIENREASGCFVELSVKE
jgi:sensor histidine kinase YesM